MSQAVVAVLGERSRPFLVSGDPVADHAALKRFVELYDESHSVESPTENSRTLLIGANPWAFPIPLVKGKAGWAFDIAAGEKELLARRVGGNELDTIQVCLGYVGAQEDYLARNPDGSSVPHYADRLFSSPGKRDGLYWETKPGEPESPMGPSGQRRGQRGLRGEARQARALPRVPLPSARGDRARMPRVAR